MATQSEPCHAERLGGKPIIFTTKTLEQRFLKEFKASCKNSGESELKQKQSEMRHTL